MIDGIVQYSGMRQISARLKDVAGLRSTDLFGLPKENLYDKQKNFKFKSALA